MKKYEISEELLVKIKVELYESMEQLLDVNEYEMANNNVDLINGIYEVLGEEYRLDYNVKE